MKNHDLLDSWKEISSYLERDIRTCIRWEKDLDLPVHRMDESSSRSKVFAYKSEIDAWLQQRANGNKFKKISLLKKRRNVITVIAAFLFISLILSILYLKEVISPQDSRLSLAVLPFDNQSSSEYDEYFSAGIMNDIIAKIINIGRFEVIPAALKPQDSNRAFNEEEILKKIDADYILRGGTQKDDLNITIHVQLTRSKDGKSIFNQEFQGTMEDIFTLQMEICRKIYESVDLPFDESRFRKASSYMAFDAFSKGNFILEAFNENSNEPWKLWIQGEKCHGYITKESNDQAIRLFESALEIDNQYARAYLGLARGYANLVNFNWDKNIQWLAKAEEFAKKGQSLEPDLPEYFSTLIEIHLLQEINLGVNKKELMYELAQKGLKKHPYFAPLLSIVGYYYFAQYGEAGDPADFTKALEFKDKAYFTSPFTTNNLVYSEFLMLNQEYTKALKICNLCGRDDDSSNTAYRVAEIYYYMGDLATSRMIFEQIPEEIPTVTLFNLFYYGMMAAQVGDREQALKIVEKINLLGQDGLLKGFNLKMASIYMGLDMKEMGFQYLDTFFKKPFVPRKHHIYLKYINIDRNFDRYKEEIFNIYNNKIGESE